MPEADNLFWATFNGVINQTTLNNFCTMMTLAGSRGVTAIHLALQSPGGSVADGIAMFNYVRNSPIPIVVYNCGGVGSIASIVYLGGTYRIVDRLANFMLHMPSNNYTNVLHRGNISVFERTLSLDEERIAMVIRERTSLKDDDWMVHDRDLYISAEDAVECKIAHAVGEFKPTIGSIVHNICV